LTEQPHADVRSGPQRGLHAAGGAQVRSYGDILASSLLIGASSAITVILGIVRTKALAVMLGPAGFGLIALYTSIADLTRSVASLGIGGSAVRQVAEAAASANAERIGRTLSALRAVSVALGVAGALFLVASRDQVSRLSFGDTTHAGAVALLGLAVFCQLLADRYSALIQGMRRIADLAQMGVLNALLGTAASIVVIYSLRESGIALSLAATAAVALATGGWYARRSGVRPAAITATQTAREVVPLLKLGMAFMASGLLMAAAAYAVRALVLRQAGVEAAGLYQAAWTLGGLYIGFILNAMGVDFYPRLVGAANDDRQTNRLVNEQAEVSLLLAAPGVLATLVLAPLAVSWFYSAMFMGAADVLRWICLGMALRVISWPMGFIIVAKAKQSVFILTELAWTAVSVGATWWCLERFGLQGAGIAFFLSYVFHACMIYAVVRSLSGFRWSLANRTRGAVLIGVIAAVFCAQLLLQPAAGLAAGAVASLIAGVWCARQLARWIPVDRLSRPLRLVLLRLRILPGESN
jgi:PST family polysaccharide transporter